MARKSTLRRATACSFGLSATSKQYFSLRIHQQPVSSTFLSEQTSTSHQHQPNERAGIHFNRGLTGSKGAVDPTATSVVAIVKARSRTQFWVRIYVETVVRALTRR
jgi:hypothetical protein